MTLGIKGSVQDTYTFRISSILEEAVQPGMDYLSTYYDDATVQLVPTTSYKGRPVELSIGLEVDFAPVANLRKSKLDP